ncbi:hypothetical protein ACHHYP_20342 [Achlya hypogyna]|uniref:Uncharacterized protein n=1 Tax=Achlya hypogyna TaxID=1202772 RepID=A0A1V9ZLK2_ACHHY|nr:hypothetical protein ACHHYP_20342 [Achlya hypogyna]
MKCRNPFCTTVLTNPFVYYCPRWMCQQYRGLVLTCSSQTKSAVERERAVKSKEPKRRRVVDEPDESVRPKPFARRNNRIDDDSDDDADNEMETKRPAPKPKKKRAAPPPVELQPLNRQAHVTPHETTHDKKIQLYHRQRPQPQRMPRHHPS